MKNVILLLAVALTSISCNAQKKEFSPESLAYELTTLNQEKASFQSILEKHKGKKILIEIWAGWCGDCVKAMPRVKELQNVYPNVAYVFISMDKSFDKWKEAVAKHQVDGDLYWVDDAKMMKGEFGKSLDVDWIPRYIIVNEKGEIVLYRAIETDFEKIDKVLKTK
jgi:thiol-disulfide isomerase/thioredoxin